MNTIFHVQFPGLGLEFTIDRVALSLGGFNIYWYGAVIALGLLLGMVWAFRCAPDYGIDGDRLVTIHRVFSTLRDYAAIIEREA